MNASIHPEFVALREKVETMGKEISELRGNINQLDKIVGATTRLTIWQLIALIVTLCGSVIGGLSYQSNMIDKRFDHFEKRLELLEQNLSDRIESSEKNINARFEDLKQEVRAQRK